MADIIFKLDNADAVQHASDSGCRIMRLVSGVFPFILSISVWAFRVNWICLIDC